MEIHRDDFHFVTVTDEGLTIQGSKSRDRTVISDIASMYSLMSEVQNWIHRNQCPSWQEVLTDDMTQTVKLFCELRIRHDGSHFARRLNKERTTVVAHCEWMERKVQESD